MKHSRLVAAISLLAAGALALSACTTPHTTLAYASEVVDCGGKQALTASGSTAQANAMTRFISAYHQACPRQTLNYTPNGSGAGIREFLAGKTDFAGSDSPLAADQYTVAKQRCGGADAWNLPVMSVKAFLQATLGPGQVDLDKNGYIPLPPDFQSRVSSAIDAIT